MKHLLSRDSVGVLAQLAGPTVADREQAAMRAKPRQLLAAVYERCPCAVISGRGQRDVAAKLRGISGRHVVGNHGIEPGPNMSRFERDITAVYPVRARALADQQGRKREARAAIVRAVAALPRPMRAISRKLVAEGRAS